MSDIENAKSSVVLSCNTLQYMKAPLAKALQSLGSRGIDCIITIHKNSVRDNDFIQSGIKVVLRSSRHIRAAIIDRSILWFGSIELAGNLHQKEDSVMRAFMPEVASEMLGYLIERLMNLSLEINLILSHFVRLNANLPDVLSFSAIIESTKIRKIHCSGRVYTMATGANEL